MRPQATISGETAAERRVFAIGDADIQALRRFLCFEPGPTPLLAGAYVRDSLVATTDERLYVLIPRSRSTGPRHLGRRRAGSARFGPRLRGAIAAPAASLDQVPAARSELDRVERPVDTERVTSLTRRERATRRDRCPRPGPLIRQPIR